MRRSIASAYRLFVPTGGRVSFPGLEGTGYVTPPTLSARACRYDPAMGKSRIALIVLPALAVLLAGCSGGSQLIAEQTPASAAPPTQVAEASTVAQWASLIAQQKSDWDDWSESWDDSDCDPIGASRPNQVICRMQLTSATFMSQTTTIEYELATGKGKKGYIAATPPAEISSLFAHTRAAAQEAKGSGEAWDAADCVSGKPAECASLTVEFYRAIEDLQRAFVGWEPYM